MQVLFSNYFNADGSGYILQKTQLLKKAVRKFPKVLAVVSCFVVAVWITHSPGSLCPSVKGRNVDLV